MPSRAWRFESAHWYHPYFSQIRLNLIIHYQSMTYPCVTEGSSYTFDVFERYRDEISPTKKSHRNEHNRLNRLLRHKIAKYLLEEVDEFHFDEFVEEALT